MKYLFYKANLCGSLTLIYYDEEGKRHKHIFIDYTLKEAIQKLRKEYDIKYKHLIIKEIN